MSPRTDPRQFDMFASLMPVRAPSLLRRVEPHGSVVQGKIDETLKLPHPRMAWDYARIELHQHTDGLWMWATQSQDELGGGGYRVGPKWGNFAQSRDDALSYACQELRAGGRRKGRAGQLIETWLASLAA